MIEDANVCIRNVEIRFRRMFAFDRHYLLDDVIRDLHESINVTSSAKKDLIAEEI